MWASRRTSSVDAVPLTDAYLRRTAPSFLIAGISCLAIGALMLVSRRSTSWLLIAVAIVVLVFGISLALWGTLILIRKGNPKP
jgi:ABC-type multidrug transport system permease subunit